MFAARYGGTKNRAELKFLRSAVFMLKKNERQALNSGADDFLAKRFLWKNWRKKLETSSCFREKL